MEETNQTQHEIKPEAEQPTTSDSRSHKDISVIPKTGRVVIAVVVFLIVTAIVVLILVRGSKPVAATQTEKSAASDTSAEKSSSPDVAAPTQEQLKQVSVESVTERTIETERETTGKVAFNEERMTPVFTPYAGRVMELKASKGEVVKAGQMLLVLESPELVAAQNDLVATISDENKARIGLDAAQKSAERARALHEREAMATKDLQQSEFDLERAKDELARAHAAVAVVESRLAMFGKNSKDLLKTNSKGNNAPDSKVTINAPINGTVVERKVGLGQYIKPDLPDPLFLISDLSTVWVMADVYESYLSKIRIGQPVEITVAAYPGRSFPARVSFINPTVDAATRTIRVRCLVTNTGGLLKPDMFARVKIDAAAPQPVPVVPASAVITLGTDSMVFVEEPSGQFRRRPVKIGRDWQGMTVIEDGLKIGERVVTHGVLILNELAGGAEK